MNQITSILLFLIISSNYLFGQEFHKIYPNDVYMNITDLYPTDSCYYYTACHGTVRYTESEVAFGKLDLDGNIVFQHTYQQGDSANFPNRTYAQMQLNFRGNFMITHSAIGPDGWFPRLMEITTEGVIVNDFRLNFTAPDSVTLGDNVFMNMESSDSTFDIVSTYRYRNYDNNPPGPETSQGAIWMKINQFGDTIWTKRYHSTQSLNGQNRYSPIVFTSLNDSVNLLICREYKLYGSLFQESNNWSKMHFLWLDKLGNILETKTMQTSQVCFGGSGFVPLPDSTMIYVYDDSFLVPYNSTTDVFKYIPRIAQLDHDLTVLWKDTLVQKAYPNFGAAGVLRKIQVVDENSMIYAYHKGTYVDTNAVFLQGTNYVRIEKRRFDGEIDWNRNFYYYPDTSVETSPGGYEIFDIELTPDGGIIIGGLINSMDSMYAQVPSEFGYILKTNCLGFLGSPSAGLTHQNIGAMEVQFINSSTEAGSFDWYFGDGTHLLTGEGKDTIIHEYLTFGPHNGMLVANGCNGEADTIRFEVNPVYHFDPSIVTEGQGYFTIFPNPVVSGDYLFIYLNNVDPEMSNLNLRIVTTDGKLTDQFQLEAKEGNHWMHTDLRAGMYHALLFEGDKLLQKRKFIVL